MYCDSRAAPWCAWGVTVTCTLQCLKEPNHLETLSWKHFSECFQVELQCFLSIAGSWALESLLLTWVFLSGNTILPLVQGHSLWHPDTRGTLLPLGIAWNILIPKNYLCLSEIQFNWAPCIFNLLNLPAPLWCQPALSTTSSACGVPDCAYKGLGRLPCRCHPGRANRGPVQLLCRCAGQTLPGGTPAAALLGQGLLLGSRSISHFSFQNQENDEFCQQVSVAWNRLQQ